jgi:superfamily I DNA and RNA helicase
VGLPQPVGHQYDVVYMRPSGHHVVLGTAGTGKTVMAIHRAIIWPTLTLKTPAPLHC